METATGIASRTLAGIERSSMMSWLGKRFWRILLALLIVASPAYYFSRGESTAAQYIAVPVTRGPIVRSVTATKAA